MIMLFNEKEDCCGCTACKSACPKQAISMKQDEEGFLYPYVDEVLCVECGVCRSVCTFQRGYDTSSNLTISDVYAVKHKDSETRMNSRSGGMFTAVSDYILDKNGITYGAGFKDRFIVCHKRAATKSERDELRGSKYVQSEMGEIYTQIKRDLQGNKWVLFSGTPCQTAGLKAFLRGNFDKLILCDIICHGTPSPKVWMDYLSFMERRYKGIISQVDFRNKKRFGWASHRETLGINGKEYDSNIYSKLFYSNDALRPSCYNCKYTNRQRPSDITLADFWGIDEAIPSFSDNKGVSLVMINTQKGQLIFEKIKANLDFRSVSDESFVQPNLKQPTKRPPKREQFWEEYYKKGFKYIAKRYGGYGIGNIIKRVLKALLTKLKLIDTVKKLLSAVHYQAP